LPVLRESSDKLSPVRALRDDCTRNGVAEYYIYENENQDFEKLSNHLQRTFERYDSCMFRYVSKWAIPLIFCFLALALVSALCVLAACIYGSNYYVGLVGMFGILSLSLLFFVLGFTLFMENILRKRNFESRYLAFTKYGQPEMDSYFFSQLINLGCCGLGVYFIFNVLRVFLN